MMRDKSYPNSEIELKRVSDCETTQSASATPRIRRRLGKSYRGQRGKQRFWCWFKHRIVTIINREFRQKLFIIYKLYINK